MLWYMTDVYTMNLSENSDGMVNLNNNKSTNFIANNESNSLPPTFSSSPFSIYWHYLSATSFPGYCDETHQILMQRFYTERCSLFNHTNSPT